MALLAMHAFVPQLQPGDGVPPIPMIDQRGHPFSIDDLRGNAVIVSFIYTRCADPRMCPLTSAKFARLQRGIAGRRIRLLEVTLDPRFDTPAVLRRYGNAYAADPRVWTLATGEPAALDAFAERFGVATAWTRPGILAHPEVTAVLAADGRVERLIDGSAWSVDDVLAVAAGNGGAAPLARAMLWLTSAVEQCGGRAGALNALEVLALFVATAGAIGLVFRSLFVRRKLAADEGVGERTEVGVGKRAPR